MTTSTSSPSCSSRTSHLGRGLFARGGTLSRWILLGAVVVRCACQPLLAQAPINDAFPGSGPLLGHTNTITCSNVGASSELGEPGHAGNPATASLWWTWIAPDSGIAIVDTQGSSIDTVLAVYVGETVSALSLVDASDDAAGLATSLVSFSAVQGFTYRIVVDGYRGESGPIQLRLRLPVAPAPPAITSQPISQTVPDNGMNSVTFAVTLTGSFPLYFEWQKNGERLVNGADATYTIANVTLGDAGDYRVIITNFFGSITSSVARLTVLATSANDLFAARVAITGLTNAVKGHNYGATTEQGEPVHAGVSNGASVWWSWTAPQNGLVRLDTAGSTHYLGQMLDTVLAVYAGAGVDTLSPVAANDDETPGLIKSSRVRFRAIVGETYQIAVAGGVDNQGVAATGDIALHLALAPDNDFFMDALAFPPGVAVVFDDNTGTTIEQGEPSHGGNSGGMSVWWYWVAPTNGTYVLDTVGSTIDTVLAVYTGTTLSGLTLVGEDDNRSDDGASMVKFLATGGTTYRFAVDGFAGADGVAAGPIVLNLNASLDSNDDFAHRMTLSGQTNRVEASNVGASKESGEPQHGGNAGGRSVWWTWTAHFAAPVVVTTRNSSFDTSLAVYTGRQVSSLTLVAENEDTDPANPAAGSSVLFWAVAGQTYQIAVDGYRSSDGTVAEGAIVLHLLQGTPAVSGGNDMFVNRFPITGPISAVIGVTTSASKELGEPNHAGNDGGRSVWWSWVAPVSTSVSFATARSSFNTVLAVYRGSDVSALTLVTADEDSAEGDFSLVTFEAVQGVEYQIAVDGFNDGGGAESGMVVLTLSQYASEGLHANDDFENATPLSDQFLTVMGLNIGATRQPGEPAHVASPQGHSVWWTWKASADGPVTISTTHSQLDTLLGVYTGSEVGSLSLVAENDDIDAFNLQSRVTFQAVAGTIYRIAVDGYANAIGLITLAVSPGPDVPSAPVIQQTPADQTRFFGGGGGGTNVSFRVVATGSLPMSFQWLRNGVIVAGATNDSLTLTNAVGLDIGSYQVAVSNAFGAVTSAGAEFSWFGVPFNDDFLRRIVIPGSSNQVRGSILGASKEPNEPRHGAEVGGRSVWWQWVAPASGPVEVNTFGSSFDTLLAVYQGHDVGSLSLIGENNDWVRNRVSGSRVVWSAVAGQEYQIAVDVRKTNGAAGNVLLTVRQPPLVDNISPTVTVSLPSGRLAATGPIIYTVSYADEDFVNTTLSAGDVTLNKSGTANGLVSVSGSGATRTVTLSGITGDGTLGISISAGTATDMAGNSAAATEASATCEVDNTRPTVAISGPSLGLSNSDPVTYTITYADRNFGTITLGAADVQLLRTGSANGSVTVLINGSTATVTLSNIAGEGTLGISIGDGTAHDQAGNSAAEVGPSATFTLIDTIAPAVSSKPDLLDPHDTGLSSIDDITSAAVLTFVGTGESGTLLTLKEGSSILGGTSVVDGSWSLSLTNLPAGAHDLTAILTDTAGNISAPSDPLHLVVDRTAPTISVIPDQVVRENESVNVTFIVADTQSAGSDVIARVASSNISLIPNANLIASGTGSGRTLMVTPVPNLSGSAEISLTVTDLSGNAVTRAFHVRVQALDGPPTLSAIPDQSVMEASGVHVLTLTGISSGPGEVQTISIRALSDNIAIVDHPVVVLGLPLGSATLVFAPVGHATGKVTISVIITKTGTVGGGVNFVMREFHVSVETVNFSPSVQHQLADASGVYGSNLSFTLPGNSFADSDPDDVLSYTSTGVPAGIAFDPATRTFSGTPRLAGVFMIGVRATDLGGLSATNSFRFTVAKVPLVITADNKVKVYGAPLPALRATYVGFVDGDTTANLGSPAVLSTPATASSSVGTYSIAAVGATSPNYEISSSPGTLTISRANLKIAAGNCSSVYGDAISSFAAIFTEFAAGDTAASLDVPVVLTCNATISSRVGAYPITVTGGDDFNYTVERLDGLLTIVAAPLTVQGHDVSRSYHAENPFLDGTITGLKNGDSISVMYSTAATLQSSVGSYFVLPTVTDPSGVLSCYDLGVVQGHLTVLDRFDAAGVVSDGYIAGATVFFDANNNGNLDADEPSATTRQDGRFSFNFPVSVYDKNHNARVDSGEGVIAVTGGIDISTGLAFKGALSAPLGAGVITPLTALISVALEQYPQESEESLQSRIKAGLGISNSVDLIHYDPMASLLANDESGRKVMSAAAMVQDTVVQVSALLASSLPQTGAEWSRQVTRSVMSQILSGSSDLSRPEVVRNIIHSSISTHAGPDAVLAQAAAEAIAGGNTAISKAASASQDPREAVLEIVRLQGIAQRDLATAFSEATVSGTSPDAALAILRQAQDQIATRTSPVGVLTAEDLRPGRLLFNAPVYQVSSLGSGSAKITVIRADGNYGPATVAVKLGTSPTVAPVVLEFGHREICQTVNVFSLVGGSSEFANATSVDLTLQITTQNGTNSPALGSVTTAVLFLRTLPTVTDPVSVVSMALNQATLSVTVTGFPEPRLQWVKNGQSLVGQTNSSLLLINLRPEDEGAYQLAALNAAGSAISKPVLFSPKFAPTVSGGVARVSVLRDTPEVLHFSVSGTPPIQYQWRKNGGNLAGQTNAWLNLGSVSLTDSGVYSLVVRNDYGMATGPETTLVVEDVSSQFLGVVRRPDGIVELSISLPLGHRYLLEKSMDLRNWATVTEINPLTLPHEMLVSGTELETRLFFRINAIR